MPNGANLVTGLPFLPENITSEHSITDKEIKVCISNDNYSIKWQILFVDIRIYKIITFVLFPFLPY